MKNILLLHPGEGGPSAHHLGLTRRPPDGELANGLPTSARRAPGPFLRPPSARHAEHQPQRTPARGSGSRVFHRTRMSPRTQSRSAAPQPFKGPSGSLGGRPRGSLSEPSVDRCSSGRHGVVVDLAYAVRRANSRELAALNVEGMNEADWHVKMRLSVPVGLWGGEHARGHLPHVDA